MKELSRINPRLKLLVSKRARRMALRLDMRDRVMRLVVPPRASLHKAFDFARQHKDWISEKLATLPEPIPFVHGAEIPVLGLNRTIRIAYKPEARVTNITMTKDEILVVTNKEDPTSRIVRFLRERARERITELANEKAELIGKKIRSIQVRDTKSRWGSCAQDGSLSFSWRLIFAPRAALDYVVAHEVAHLTHMNHGKRFWTLCEELSQHYECGKDWMHEHGHELLRYGGEV